MLTLFVFCLFFFFLLDILVVWSTRYIYVMIRIEKKEENSFDAVLVLNWKDGTKWKTRNTFEIQRSITTLTRTLSFSLLWLTVEGPAELTALRGCRPACTSAGHGLALPQDPGRNFQPDHSRQLGQSVSTRQVSASTFEEPYIHWSLSGKVLFLLQDKF